MTTSMPALATAGGGGAPRPRPTPQPSPAPAEVQDRVRAALEQLARQDADRLHVRVDGSQVTLTGVLRTGVERRCAERAAWSVPGVVEVRNLITLGVG